MEQYKLWQFDTPVTDEAVIMAWQGRVEYWLTRRQISTAMHRAKTPAVNARCEALVEKGALEKAFITLPNGVNMITYHPVLQHELCQILARELSQSDVLF
jgi:hypothetical protein